MEENKQTKKIFCFIYSKTTKNLRLKGEEKIIMCFERSVNARIKQHVLGASRISVRKMRFFHSQVADAIFPTLFFCSAAFSFFLNGFLTRSNSWVVLKNLIKEVGRKFWRML
jgi:hypothetical protein